MTQVNSPSAVTVDDVLAQRIVAILRSSDHVASPAVAEALIAGGLTAIEVTVQSDSAYRAIERIRATSAAEVHIGAGTVLTEAQGLRAIEAGASFLVSPHLDAELCRGFVDAGIAYIPGVATPTEVRIAASAGCTTVKLFPAGPLGGGYLRALRGPFPDTRFMVTGGVDVEEAHRWFNWGAAAVGLGGTLAPREIVSADQLRALTDRARTLIEGLPRDANAS
ncbi:MAG: bifunctional 4-hydroxy-2-oxoglutarate aldolase/2-dehydro-3-deoxy-phosphogluconate aldolase [Vicinamibacterales bacterium]